MTSRLNRLRLQNFLTSDVVATLQLDFQLHRDTSTAGRFPFSEAAVVRRWRCGELRRQFWWRWL